MVGRRIVAGRLVRLACQRHLTDLKEGAARGLRFNPALAAYGIRFFGFLRHSKGEWGGQPIVLAPWQQFVVGSVWGWLRADGTRRFRVIYEEIARKNGKSTKLAGIGLIGLVADGELGAEVYAAATKRDQARIIFGEAQRMCRVSPELRRKIGIFKNNLSIDATASKFEPLSADEKTLDGLNPHFVLIDELHKHRNRAVLDVMDTALGSRRQPLLWIITTAGDDNPESVYAAENDYAVKVLEGTLQDDALFAYIATIDKGDRWDDPKVWIKANPNLGISVKVDDLQRQALKAKNSPAAQAAFKRLRLNVRSAAALRAIDMEAWGRNSGGRFDPMMLVDRLCLGGLDLSSKIDLSAFVKLFPPVTSGERWRVVCRFWMPADNVLERQDVDRAPYQRWIDEGWVEATPGNIIDHDTIEAAIVEDARQFELREVAFDPWNATQIAVRLEDQAIRMIEFIQGIRSYTAPMKELLARIRAGELDHGDNPVLAWMASNLKVTMAENNNQMPSKKHSLGRIDGMTALLMALGRAMAEDDQTLTYGGM